MQETNRISVPLASPIVSVAISPDGKFIAYGDATKEVRVVDAETKKFKMIKGLWTNHKARITSLSWTPSSDVGSCIAAIVHGKCCLSYLLDCVALAAYCINWFLRRSGAFVGHGDQEEVEGVPPYVWLRTRESSRYMRHVDIHCSVWLH